MTFLTTGIIFNYSLQLQLLLLPPQQISHVRRPSYLWLGVGSGALCDDNFNLSSDAGEINNKFMLPPYQSITAPV